MLFHSAALLSLSGFGFSLPAIRSEPPRTIIANVSVIHTPIIKDALAFAKENSDTPTYNHVVRSWLYGSLVIARNASIAAAVDLEVHGVGAILHDLGWDERLDSPFITPDRRFEVDGAFGARNFVRSNADSKKWGERRTQLLWDSIALHTQQAIWTYKENEVLAVGAGIFSDLQLDQALAFGITKQEYETVKNAFPAVPALETLKEKMIWLCRTKPAPTYGKQRLCALLQSIADFNRHMDRAIW
jgi:hypothetical protein